MKFLLPGGKAINDVIDIIVGKCSPWLSHSDALLSQSF